jgi:hypothetical protein
VADVFIAGFFAGGDDAWAWPFAFALAAALADDARPATEDLPSANTRELTGDSFFSGAFPLFTQRGWRGPIPRGMSRSNESDEPADYNGHH